MSKTLTPDYWVERYAAAQSIQFAADAVANGAVYPHWIDDSHFWYQRRALNGIEYRVVEASSGSGYIALTRAAVAEALALHLKVDVDPEVLIIRDLKIDPVAQATFNAFGKTFTYDLMGEKVVSAIHNSGSGWIVSPDGGSAAFVRDYNLWLKDMKSGAERALTTDGEEHYAYADAPVCNRGRIDCSRPEGLWSPDSKRFLTLQVDDRHVPDLAMIEFVPHDGVRPRVISNKTSLPGDLRVTEFRMISIDIETNQQTEADYPRLSAVRMNGTPFNYNLVWWNSDSLTAYFVDIERGERMSRVVMFDCVSGATRVVFSETSDTYLELGVNVYAPASIYPLVGTNEIVWYSERSGRGHLYLYGLEFGELKGAITSGPWQVRDVQHVDVARREIFFTAAGIADEEEPYICKPCIASLDGGPVRVLSAEPGDHIVWRPGEYALSLFGIMGGDRRAVSGVSPSGEYFVETVGAANRLPRTVLRSRSGEEIAILEVAEDRGLPVGWVWPDPVKVKAANGDADSYGLLFKPWGYDPSRSYPVIDYIYGGPQLGFVPKSAFALGGIGSDIQYLEAAHLSALGAFVLVLDGRGTAYRERAFRQASYGAIHTASNVEDHISGIRELAARYPSMDLKRVGICGFSGGGYATALAALRFGKFFQVAVAGGGNYDQSLFWHCWGERYHGQFDPEHYAVQAAKTYAAGLTGKLML